MWYSPLAFSVGKRDVIGAWLMCLVVAAVFFTVSASIDRWAAESRTVAAMSQAHATPGKCA